MKTDEIVIRLRRTEGQLRGIQKMIENDRYWKDIIHQIVAVQSATKNVGIILLDNHVRECIEKAIEKGNGDEEIKEIILIVKQFIK